MRCLKCGTVSKFPINFKYDENLILCCKFGCKKNKLDEYKEWLKENKTKLIVKGN